jgi:hypothetical protein
MRAAWMEGGTGTGGLTPLKREGAGRRYINDCAHFRDIISSRSMLKMEFSAMDTLYSLVPCWVGSKVFTQIGNL